MCLPSKIEKPGSTWFLGLDLAQRQDFTALAALNLEWRNAEQCKVTYNWIRKPELTLCDLDRYKQGQSYLAYCNLVERRIDQIRASEAGATIQLAIDASGLDIKIHPVTMNGGAKSSANKHGGQNIPRRSLITKLILLMEHGTFRADPDILNLDEFQHEMLNLRANDTAAESTGDLVVATSLAAWQAINTTPELLPTREQRRTYIAAGTRRLL